MFKKKYWLVITAIAIACIILPAISGAYNSAAKKDISKDTKTPAAKVEETTEIGDLSPVAAEPGDETETPEEYEQYTVLEGDNLWLIARKFDTYVDSLKELNQLTEEAVYPGQVLLIPNPGEKPQKEEPKEQPKQEPANTKQPEKKVKTTSSRDLTGGNRYTVQNGDSLWTIANRFQTNVSAIKEMNNLTSENIRAGQVLVIPRVGTVSRQVTNTTSTPKAASGTKVTSTSQPPQPKSGVVGTAKQYMGAPYIYGGSSPSGFDCSGFVQYVYKKHGINLPRVASDQSRVGTKVDQLAPGDLVFFANSGSVSHVGIYVADNSFIHANVKQGVIITSLSTQWYRDRYYGARRI